MARRVQVRGIKTAAEIADARAQKRAATIAATVAKRAAQAQSALDRNLKKLERAQRAVARWRRKVAYYQTRAARAGV